MFSKKEVTGSFKLLSHYLVFFSSKDQKMDGYL